MNTIKILLVAAILLGWWAGGLCEPWGDDYQNAAPGRVNLPAP